MASPTNEQSDKVQYSNPDEEATDQENGQTEQNVSTQDIEMTDTNQDLETKHHFDGSQPLTSEFHHHAVGEGVPSAGSAFHVVSQTDGHKDRMMIGQPDSEPENGMHSEIALLDYDDSKSAEGHHREDSVVSGKLFSAHIVEHHTSPHDDLCSSIVNESQHMQARPTGEVDEDALLDISDDKAALEGMNIDDADAVDKLLHASEEGSFSEVRSKHLSEDLKVTEMSETKSVEDFQFLKPSLMESTAKDSSVVGNSADNDVENELGKQHPSPFHKPEAVFNIDEETRMGLDQTPVDPTMIEIEASFIYPTLPPKKLFQLDDTKDSEASDTETKMSAICDTEDIRLINTISIDDVTKDSAASDSNAETPTPSRKQRRASRDGLGISLMEGLEAGERVFTADNLFEYQWPQDGGEWHLLQEQISEYLKVKSFKRKYPDLYRRTCDKEEKDFLRDKGVVTETQSDLGLTALRSEEVYDLMMKDYNSKYKDYISHLQEKQKKVIREKHKEYSQAKLDKSKIETYSKKAARSAAEFNASLMRDKKEERRAYFDLQTYTIHFPKNKFRTLPPQYTKVGAYPVSLIPGQFQENYRKYSAEELRYYPVRTSIKDPPKVVKYVRPPPPGAKLPISDKQKTSAASDGEESGSSSRDDNDYDSENNDNAENEDKENEIGQVEGLEMASPVKLEKKIKGATKRKLKNSSPDRLKKAGKKSKDVDGERNDDRTNIEGEEKGVSPVGNKMPGKIHGLEKCRICKKRSTKEERKTDKLVKCAECGKIGHVSCLDLTEELVAVIKTYPWQCMECKTCVECLDPYDEDKMMFCDRCDRGYHTFCIGLDALPTGHWECKSCEGRVKTPEKPKSNITEGSYTGRTKKLLQVIAAEPSTSVKNEPELLCKDEPEVPGKDEAELLGKDVTELPGKDDAELPGKDDADLKSGDAETPTDNIQELQQVSSVAGEKETPSSEKDGAASSDARTPVKAEHKSRKRSATKVTPKAKAKLTPKPTPPTQERIQGARQSRRLKIKEEVQEERRKKGDDGKSHKKKKKSKKTGGEPKIDDGVKEEAMDEDKKIEAEAVKNESPPDGLRETVSEVVDDSFVNIFDKNEDKDRKVTDSAIKEANVKAQPSNTANIEEKGNTDALEQKIETMSAQGIIDKTETGELNLRADNVKKCETKSTRGKIKTGPVLSETLDNADALKSGTISQNVSEGETLTSSVALLEIGLTSASSSQLVVSDSACSDPAQGLQSPTQLLTLPEPATSSLPVGDLSHLQVSMLPTDVPPVHGHSQSGTPPISESKPSKELHTESQSILLEMPGQEPIPQEDLLHETPLNSSTSVINTDIDLSVQSTDNLTQKEGQTVLDPTQNTSVDVLNTSHSVTGQSSLENETCMDVDEQ